MVFRYGGEEFAVVLPETNKPDIIAVAERIRANVSLTRFMGPGMMSSQHLTVSIGACIFPVDAQNFEEVIDNVDKHLYSAKRLGRDRICFSSEMKEVEDR